MPATDWLSSKLNINYLSRSLPDGLDSRIESFVSQWAAESVADRLQEAEHVDGFEAQTLLVYSQRASTLAVIGGRDRFLESALLAAGMDDMRHEPEESLCAFAVVMDAARRLGIDPTPLFQRVAAIAPPAASGEMLRFLSRPASEQDIAAFGLTFVPSGIASQYRRTW